MFHFQVRQNCYVFCLLKVGDLCRLLHCLLRVGDRYRLLHCLIRVGDLYRLLHRLLRVGDLYRLLHRLLRVGDLYRLLHRLLRVGDLYRLLHCLLLSSPCGLTIMWWGCYSLCQRHKPTELAHSFLFLFLCLFLFFVVALSTIFHLINSPDNSPFFLLLLTLFFRRSIYLFMKVSLSPDMIRSR